MKKMKNLEKVKKGIDKVEKKWYNNKAVGESNKLSRKVEKLEKVLKNHLTNRQQSDIINKLSTERLAGNRSLKIEQQ